MEDLVNVRNSVQDGFLKIDVEWCVEEMIQKVEEDAERTPRLVARRLFEEGEEHELRFNVFVNSLGTLQWSSMVSEVLCSVVQ